MPRNSDKDMPRYRNGHSNGHSNGHHTVQMEPPPDAIDYSVFFSRALDMLCIAGFDGYFKQVNPQWERVLGYTSEELLAQPFLEFVHPDDREMTIAESRKIMADGVDTISFENRYRCKDGTYRILQWNSTVVPEEKRIYATARDVTGERQTQQELERLNAELRQSRALLQGLIDNAPAVIYAKSVERQMLVINRTFATFVDRPREDILGKTDHDLFPLDMADMFYAQDEEVLRSGQPITEEQDILLMDGMPGTFWNVKFPIYDEQGQVIALAGIATDITPRKRAEDEIRRLNTELEQRVVERTAELRESRALLQGILDHSPAVIYVKDTQGRYLLANRSYETLFHLSKEQIIGNTDADIFPTEIAAQNRTNDQAVSASQRAVSSEERIPVDGHMRIYLSAKFPLLDENGNIYATGGISTDISERKEQEALLRQNEERLRQVQDATNDGMWDWDIPSGAVYFSPRYASMLGYDLDELEPTVSTWQGLLHPDDAPYAQQLVTDHIAGRKSHFEMEFRMRRKDGDWLWVLGRGKVIAWDAQDNPQRMIGTHTNIHERKQQEERLRVTQFTLDHAPDSIFWANTDGRLIYVNDTGCTELGYTHEELLTLGIPDVNPDFQAERVPHLVARLQEHLTIRFESCHRRKDGTIFPVDVALNYLDYQGQGYLCAFIRDITERKQAEVERERLVAIVENSLDFVATASLEGEPVYISPAGLAMVGLESMEQARQYKVIDFFPAEDRPFFEEQILPAVMQDGFWQGEFRYRHFQTDALIPVHFTLFLVKDPATGAILGIGTVTRDITEQKRTEAERTTLQQQVIDAQRDALRELSTPLIPISNRVVIMPLIGTIDSTRAQQVMETLLQGVAQQQARLAIIDITGVQVVDTQVAQALVQATQAVKLLGAQVMLTGIQPRIAHTLVTLGVDLSGIITRGTLQAGIAEALGRKELEYRERSR